MDKKTAREALEAAGEAVWEAAPDAKK